MKKLRRSWNLVKSSWAVVRSDAELVIFPVLSILLAAVLAVVVGFAYLQLTGQTLDELGNRLDSGGDIHPSDIIALVVFAVTVSVGASYLNAALIGAALIRLRGGNPSVKDGLAAASKRRVAILGYGLISATVGLLLGFLQSRDNAASKIGGSLLSTGWGLANFLTVPIIVDQDVGAPEAIKRSGSLLRKTWGEQVIGTGSMSVIATLVILPTVLIGGGLVAWLYSSGSEALSIGLGALLVLLVAAIGVVFSALNAIYQAALYEFATTNVAPPEFGEATMGGAFAAAS